MANTRTWDIEWDEEQTSRPDEASMEEFAAFVCARGYREVSRRILMSLYWEFVEATETRPVTRGRFNKELKLAGFRRVRLTGGTREYRYRLASSRPKLVARNDHSPVPRRSVA